jgi:hypothetical protein
MVKKNFFNFKVGGTCLFLASKAEETFKKIQEIILICEKVHHKNELSTESSRFANLRENYFKIEQNLLTTLNFDLKIDHPYKYLVQFVKKVENFKKTQNEEIDLKKFAQVAWNFVNDSLKTRTAYEKYFIEFQV